MQQPHYTPAHAQHVPAGWSFPTLEVATSPMSAPAPVTGGGATSTVTRVRWGRLLPLFAGIVLVAFGIWSVTQDGSAPSSPTVRGGGAADDLEIARAARTDVGSEDAAAPDVADSTARSSVPETTPPAAATPRAGAGANAAPVARPARRPAARPAARPSRRVVAGGGGVAATAARATPAAAAPAAGAPRDARGAGAPSGELPLTGIETWIAAILGILLLGVGICVHVNAVRIAATAMLYRRGILLRPVDCARLAQERGLPQAARVWLSNALHRLLEEPAHGDFVATRLAR